MKFTIFQNSRQGPRPYNEDRLAYSYSKESLLLVLADGMGGHRNGELAAQLAITTMTEAFQRLALPALSNPAKFLMDHIQQTHDMIEQMAISREMLESPRTTIVAAIVQRNTLYCAHAGDSRLYHFRNGHLLFRTEDHSVVQSLYKRGIIEHKEMGTHPYRHKVYSCLGGDVPPKIELGNKQELQEGDTILLCSDGVWGQVPDNKIKRIMSGVAINEDITELLNLAETTGGKEGDNMSAVGLQWGDKQASNFAVSTLAMSADATTTIFSSVTESNHADALNISDDEIERTIAEIQQAIQKTKSTRNAT